MSAGCLRQGGSSCSSGSQLVTDRIRKGDPRVALGSPFIIGSPEVGFTEPPGVWDKFQIFQRVRRNVSYIEIGPDGRSGRLKVVKHRNPLKQALPYSELLGAGEAATCNRYLAALNTLFRSAKIWGYVDRLPTDDLSMLKEQCRVPGALANEQLEKLLQHCQEPTRTVVAIAADTGLRRSELRRQAWRDVDLEGGTLTIRQTKNAHFRVLPLTRRVTELLGGLATQSPPRELVLPQGDFSRPLAKAAKRAGVGHVHPHTRA